MTRPQVAPADRVFLAEANASERTSVLFIHGLWLHGTSWTPWVDLFEQKGFVGYAPSWPGDGMTALETRQHPELVAHQTVEEVMGHYRKIISSLHTPPIVVGHCFGGLLAQKILGEGLAEAAVAVDPTPMRGMPDNALTVDRWRARIRVPLRLRGGVKLPTRASFASAFGSKLNRQESDRIYQKYAIPASRQILVQTGLANYPYRNLPTVQTHTHRGPLLIVGGNEDRRTPMATSRETFEQYDDAPSITEFREFSDRGHTLIADDGWKEIAEYALGWLAFVGLTFPLKPLTSATSINPLKGDQQ